MRRFFLTFTVISLAGWSQPAQQPAQPPIAVKVEMPPTNPWMRMMELVIPGIIGAGLALFGVWLTNKNNAATNAANRQHELDVERIKDEIAPQAKSRDNRWEFRKDVYVNLITATSGLIRAWSGCRYKYERGQPTQTRTDTPHRPTDGRRYQTIDF